MMTGFSFAVLLLSMHFKAWAETSFPIWKMSALLRGNSLDKVHDQPAKCIGFGVTWPSLHFQGKLLFQLLALAPREPACFTRVCAARRSGQQS